MTIYFGGERKMKSVVQWESKFNDVRLCRLRRCSANVLKNIRPRQFKRRIVRKREKVVSNAKFQLLYHTQTVTIKQLSNTLCKVTQQSRGDRPGNTVAEYILSQFTPSCVANTRQICLQQFNNSIDQCSARTRL